MLMEWEKVEKWIAHLDKVEKKFQRNEQTGSSQGLVQSGMIKSYLELD